MINKNFWNYTYILLIFSLDRLTKFIVTNFTQNNDQYFIEVTSFLNFNLIWNKGIAFGLFSFNETTYYNYMTVLILIITLIVFYLMIKSHGKEKIGYLMIVGGSLGNLFDRFMYSSVPDFIDIHINNYHWFIFNVADIFITLGVIMLISLEFLKMKKK